jgi:hypothetical protein
MIFSTTGRRGRDGGLEIRDWEFEAIVGWEGCHHTQQTTPAARARAAMPDRRMCVGRSMGAVEVRKNGMKSLTAYQ